MGRLLIFFFIIVNTISCSVEKFSNSPVNNFIENYSNEKYNRSYTDKSDQISYTSEITNLISSIPKFKSNAVNAEVTKLKSYLSEYIYSLQAYNLRSMEIANNNYQKSYKNLQRLKLKLSKDEADLLNRYLVRIKTNMNLLEDLETKNTDN